MPRSNGHSAIPGKGGKSNPPSTDQSYGNVLGSEPSRASLVSKVAPAEFFGPPIPRDLTRADLKSFLRTFFDSPEGRLHLLSRMSVNDSVLLAMMDRAYGKVKESADITLRRGLDELSDEQLREMIETPADYQG